MQEPLAFADQPFPGFPWVVFAADDCSRRFATHSSCTLYPPFLKLDAFIALASLPEDVAGSNPAYQTNLVA
jgi:hypothetical protein